MVSGRYPKHHCIAVLSGGRGATNSSCYNEKLVNILKLFVFGHFTIR
jgi:hypothetical protein